MNCRFVLILLLGAAVVACSQQVPAPTSSTVSTNEPQETVALPASTERILPTLLPSSTPIPTAKPTDTRVPPPTDVPDTPIPFEDIAVELRYSIPGIGLERSLQGTVASQVTVTDEVTGISEVRRSQAGVLLELQQSLPELVLDEVPEGCDMCVQLEYDLPLAEVSEAGWLKDVQFLASVDNFTTALLGPHFPEGTIAAIRRSATPYDVAHTVALTSDGQLWRWTAVEAELDDPEIEHPQAIALAEDLAELDLGQVEDSYLAACPDGAGIEILYFQNNAEEHQIQLVCPELSLPAKLLSLYLPLADLAAEKLGDQGLPKPDPPWPIDGRILWQSENGAQLTLRNDGRAEFVDREGITYTEAVTSALVISTTNSLIGSGSLQSGVEAFTSGESNNLLLVRGDEGLFELDWNEDPPRAVAAILERLQELIDRIVDDSPRQENEEPSSTPELTLTPEASATP